MKVLVIDNFDSFTYNLVEYVSETRLGDGSSPDITVVKNTVDAASIEAEDPDALIVSPGPGHPATDRDVGISRNVVTDFAREIPTLGVCLGMETAVHAYGGTVGQAPDPVHGKAYPIHHDETGLFRSMDQGFQGGRYHSLSALEVPDEFTITAWTTQEGAEIPMGVRHDTLPLLGVQFHPESVLTPVGHDLIGTFLADVEQAVLGPTAGYPPGLKEHRGIE